MSEQAEKCLFKSKDKEKCNLATEMICNKKVCTLYIDKDSDIAKRYIER